MRDFAGVLPAGNCFRLFVVKVVLRDLAAVVGLATIFYLFKFFLRQCNFFYEQAYQQTLDGPEISVSTELTND